MAEAAGCFDVLCHLCRSALGNGPPIAAGDLPASCSRTVLSLAERHRVVPLLAAGWGKLDPSGVAAAPEWQPALRVRALALAQQLAWMERELAAISNCLAAAGIGFLILKGAATARQAYPLPEWRAYDDWDLWVPSRDLEPAVRALEAQGYRRAHPRNPRSAACACRAGIEFSLSHPGRTRFLEISHGPLALAPTRRAAREILAAAVELDIGGIRLRTPAARHALLMACAHGAHHGWERLAWVADIAGFWQRLPPAERAEACATARRWRLATMLGLGLRLAADRLGSGLEGEAADLAATGRVAALARRIGLDLIGPDTPRVAPLERLRFENDARDAAWRRWCTMAGWIFTPTVGDIEAVPLPAALYPLYAVIRPVRLMRHPWRGQWRTLAGRKTSRD